MYSGEGEKKKSRYTGAGWPALAMPAGVRGAAWLLAAEHDKHYCGAPSVPFASLPGECERIGSLSAPDVALRADADVAAPLTEGTLRDAGGVSGGKRESGQRTARLYRGESLMQHQGGSMPENEQTPSCWVRESAR